MLGVLAGLFMLYALAEVASPLFLPLVSDQLSDESWGRGQYATEVQQSTGWSCGPAALAWALRLQGLSASEREMAQLSAVMPLHGASWPGMVRAARYRGLHPQVIAPATWEQLLAAPKPLLADWRLNAATSHMLIVIRATPTSVLVGDPLTGEQTLTRAQFRARWQRGMMLFAAR